MSSSHSSGGAAPIDAPYLVAADDAVLTADIPVGATPQGELGGTWALPTVDSTHSGSSHHDQAHAADHADGGADELAVEDLATAGGANTVPKGDGAGGLAMGAVGHDELTDVGTGDHHAQAHAADHASGQSDALKLDDLAAPDDNTDLDASSSVHGLLPKLSNVSTEFLNGQGAFATPAGGGPSIAIKGSDEVVNNSATLQNDDDMVLAIGANETWIFYVEGVLDAAAASDFKYAITAPTGATGFLADRHADDEFVATDLQTPDYQDLNAFGVGNPIAFQGFAYVANGANAGNVQVQWAQLAADASNLTVHEGSRIVGWQIS